MSTSLFCIRFEKLKKEPPRTSIKCNYRMLRIIWIETLIFDHTVNSAQVEVA